MEAYNDIMSKEKKETILMRKIFIELKQSFVLLSVGETTENNRVVTVTPRLSLVLQTLVIWYDLEGTICPGLHQNRIVPSV